MKTNAIKLAVVMFLLGGLAIPTVPEAVALDLDGAKKYFKFQRTKYRTAKANNAMIGSVGIRSSWPFQYERQTLPSGGSVS